MFELVDRSHRYPSRRAPIYAANVVTTSQPLAAQAGLDALRRGGNAVDAAIACAITLTVVEPSSNGIGSDAFAIVWDGDALHGFNGSGRSPAAWTRDRFSGLESMPETGWDAVTVPGAVDTWVHLSDRFGKLPFPALFDAAIHYAREGYLLSPVVAEQWEDAAKSLGHIESFAAAFLKDGRAPGCGERVRLPDHADTLEIIADSRGESLYRGALADQMVADATRHGGVLSHEDLANHRGEWVACIDQDYHDHTLHEIPPNGQGLATLIGLGILNHLEIERYPVNSADSVHLQIEAMKSAYALVFRHLSEPDSMTVSIESLLDPDLLARRARDIRLDRASFPTAEIKPDHGTVYLAAADQSGCMVSFIQSNFHGFGSGIVVPGTGISLQNRASGFVLEENHPNEVGGSKRPFHTIIPAFVSRDGNPLMCLGLMGGHMQAQGHLQLAVRLFTYEEPPQGALDAPRWFIAPDNRTLVLEPDFGPILDDLTSRGHPLMSQIPRRRFGGGQLIQKLDHGYLAASEPRKDGQAVGF